MNKYVTGGILAVFLTAMVLGTAVAGAQTNSHFIASAGPRQLATLGGREGGRLLLPAQGSLVVNVSWCSDASAAYCVSIAGATVTVMNQAGAFVASSQTNAHGQVTFAVNSPLMYKVNVDIENVSAFGYMASNEYQLMQSSTGNAANVYFQYDAPGALPW
jgi:hypothetical protein